jgi:hypothetical protein
MEREPEIWFQDNYLGLYKHYLSLYEHFLGLDRHYLGVDKHYLDLDKHILSLKNQTKNPESGLLTLFFIVIIGLYSAITIFLVNEIPSTLRL